MPRKPPKNKPLIEAISEPRWKPREPSPKKPHPHHEIPISKMYDKISDEYPFHEPTATMPDELTGR